MKPYMILAVPLLAASVTGCGDHTGEGGAAPEDGKDDVRVYRTAYTPSLEIYVEAVPLTVSRASETLAHITRLSDSGPLEAERVTALLICGTDTVRQSLDAPDRPGVYRFFLTPTQSGECTLALNVETREGTTRVTMPGVTAYATADEARREAANATKKSPNGVTIAKETAWKSGFTTDSCRTEPVGSVIRVMAQAYAAPCDEYTVTARAGGLVALAGSGLTEGTAVQAGQTLCYLESDGMADNNLRVRLQEAESAYRLAKREYERKRPLAEEKIVSESELSQARSEYETAQALYDNLRGHFAAGRETVTVPVTGYIKSVKVTNGAYAAAGEPLFTVARGGRLRWLAEIPLRYYPLLGQIQDVTLRSPGNGVIYTLGKLHGRLLSYGKAADSGRPLLPVWFETDSAAGLIPGAFAETRVRTRGQRTAVTVPNESVVEEMGAFFVYVQLTPEYFEKRAVTTGQTDGIRTEILSGLNGAERVAAHGAVLLKLAQSAGTTNPHAGHHH